jgi:predicted transcriptional regulator
MNGPDNFFAIFRSICDEPNLTLREKMAALLVLRHRNYELETSWASEQLMAREANTSLRSMEEAIAGLVKKGILVKKRTRRGNEYTIDLKQTLLFSKSRVSATRKMRGSQPAPIAGSAAGAGGTRTNCGSDPQPVRVGSRGFEGTKRREENQPPGRIVGCPDQQQLLLMIREMAGKKTIP